MPGATEMDTFRDALLATKLRWPMAQSRSMQMLVMPQCPPRYLKQFALKCLAGAARFPGQLAAIYAIAEEPRVKLLLLENLLEECGMHVKPWQGINVYPEALHTRWIERFAQACGVADAERTRAVFNAHQDPGAPWFVSAIKEKRWLEALSYLLVGQEANFPAFASIALQTLRIKGFSDTDLVFFIQHIEADAKHGDDTIQLLADLPLTPEEQQRVLAAAHQGSDDWWALVNGSKVIAKPLEGCE
jgi:pyrroloquinoline quinone (PQQ) biosynthesis protein C